MTVFLGCTKRKTDTEIKLSEVFTEVTGKPLPQRGIVFIIPMAGCGSCIEHSVAYTLKVSLPDLYICLVKQGYNKNITRYYGNFGVLKDSAIYIDSDDRFILSGLVYNSPRLFLIEEHQIVKVVDIIPNNKDSIEYIVKSFLN